MNDLGGHNYPVDPPPSQEEKNWAMASHVGVLVGHFFAWMGFLVPLIIWLVKRGESQFVARNALNSLLWHIGVSVLGFILFIAGIFLCGLPWMLLPFVGLIDLIFIIIATMRASEGKVYEYPITGSFTR